MSRRSSVATAFVGAAMLGAAGGWLLARQHDQSHRYDLFSSSATSRFAALGWLASQDDPAQLQLLHDYLAWEPLPALQRRARRIVADLETGV